MISKNKFVSSSVLFQVANPMRFIINHRFNNALSYILASIILFANVFNCVSAHDGEKHKNAQSPSSISNAGSEQLRFLQSQGISKEIPLSEFFSRSQNETIQGTFSKYFTDSNVINGFSFNTLTEIGFIDESLSKNFTVNLNENLKRFLGEFAENDLTTLASDSAYKAYIDAIYKKRTIIIGVDGLVQSCLDFSELSAFKILIENGSYSYYTRSSTEGFSGPGWSSLFCSMTSKDTGIVNNYWHAPWISQEYTNNYNYSTPIKGLRSPFPCLFDELKAQKKLFTSKLQNSNFTNYFYSSWEFFKENFSNKAFANTFDLFADCKIQTNTTYFEYINCDLFSLEKSKVFALQNFDLYFWYFASADVAGHTFSFCSTEYFSRVESINNILNNFFDFLKMLNLLDKINIIITSDHGADRNKLAHGTDKWDGNLFVPLFMMGPDFKKNYLIKSPNSLIDIAPTIMKINNLPINDLWSGKPITEALLNNDISIKAVANPIVLIEADYPIKESYSVYAILLIFLVFF